MSKKLLLADDSITIQKVIQITFAHEDYELTITDNGDAALAKAQEIKPDLIMTDIYMPGKNGYELTSAIKQDPALRHVPVLLLAGSFEPFDEDKARSCQADAWIEKPFESQSLIDKVAELLSAAQQAPATSIPDVDREMLAAVESSDVSFEDTPLEAFDAPANTEPEEAAAPEDPFGDISFEEDLPVVEPEPFAVADDWGDVALKPAAAAPVVEEAFANSEDFSFTEEEPAAAVAEDFSFAEEEPAAAVAEDLSFAEDESAAEFIEDFSFAEEQPMAAEVFAPVEEAPLVEAGFDAFDVDDDEIMPLGDDDILDAEDLEPVMPEQTLAAWSRDEAAVEDVFPLEEEPVMESETVFVAPVEPDIAEEAPVSSDDEPAAEVPQVSAEAAAEPASEEESAEVVAEQEAAPATAVAVDVEAQTSALSEEDVERIIEKIVTRVVEKLAVSILERVAWDVVPDLAETLIREEIRKIKDAAA